MALVLLFIVIFYLISKGSGAVAVFSADNISSKKIFFLSFNHLHCEAYNGVSNGADKQQTSQSFLLAEQDNGLQRIYMLCQRRNKHPVFILT